MKLILYPITVDLFIPFYFQLSKYLELRGYQSFFVSFLLRENIWLKKNGIKVQPSNVFDIKKYKIKDDLFSEEEIKNILNFFILKLKGDEKYWRERLLKIATYLDDVLEKNKFEAVVIWNGEDYVQKALVILAKRKGIPTIFAENGYFPNTLQFDLKGVNVNSSITQLSFSKICNVVVSNKVKRNNEDINFNLFPFKDLDWKDYLYCFILKRINPFYSLWFPERRGDSWFTQKWLQMKRSRVPLDQFVLPKKYIFIPFQVHDDTQILLNSRFFKNIEDFFEFSYRAIKKNYGDDYRIVVKEHPEDLLRYSYLKLKIKYPDVVWLVKYSIDDLINNASLVFVINSSVGLQSLQKFKPTIIFGESFYTRNEIAFCVNDINKIDEVLSQARAEDLSVKKSNIESFIRFLENDYFIFGSWKKISVDGVINAGNKIIELMELNAKCLQK